MPSSSDSGQPNDGGRAGWRGKKGPSASVARHRWQKDWVKQDLEDVRRRNRSHRLKVAAAWALFLGLTVWLVYLILNDPRQTPFVPIAITRYDFPVPPNAFAREDVERFNDLHGVTLAITDYTGVPERDLNQPWRNVHDGLNRLGDLVEEAARRASTKQVVVIYLSAQGLVDVDQQGRPQACLLPPDGSATDTDEWLPIADLLTYLHEKKELAGRKKLLLLDVQRIDSHWSLGQLYNGFAELLAETVREANVPQLAVLASAGPGEIAWTSPERQASVFGYYVWSGLQGDADARVAGDDDGSISLDELASYVAHMVNNWVRINRYDAQRPELLAANTSTLTDARDWRVALVPNTGWFGWGSYERPAEPSLAGEPIDSSSADELAGLWDRHADLDRQGVFRQSPLEWQEFRRRLIWQESLLLAGKDYTETALANGEVVRELANRLRPTPPVSNNPGASFPVAAALAGDRGLANRAEEVWQMGVNQPSPDQVVRTADELERIAQSELPDNRLVEIHFLRLLNGYLPSEAWNNRSLIENNLALRERAERIAAPFDPRVHYWVDGLVDEADRSRRTAEDRLFVGGAAAWSESQADCDTAAEQYELAGTVAQAADSAFLLRDRIWSDAPHLARWLAARLPLGLPGPQREDETARRDALLLETFDELVDSTASFTADVLDVPPDVARGAVPATQDRLAILRRDSDALASRLNQLEERFLEECRELTELVGGEARFSASLLRRIEAVLDIPLVDARLRHRLTMYRNEIRRSLYQNASAGMAPGEQTGDEVSDNSPGESVYLNRLAAWDAESHPAIALVLASATADQKPSLGQARDPLTEITLQGDIVRRWMASPIDGVNPRAARLAEESIRLLKDQDQIAPTKVRKPLSQADQMLRATAVLRPRALSASDQRGGVWQLRGIDWHHFLRWQAQRTLDDFYGTPGSGDDFFATATERYLAASDELLKAVCGADLPYVAERSELESRLNAAARFVDVREVGELAGSETGDIPHHVAAQPHEQLPAGWAAIYLRNGPNHAQRVPLLDNGPRREETHLALATRPQASQGSSTDQQYLIREGALATSSAEDLDLSATFYFRGHVHGEPIPTGAVDVAFAPPPYVAPRIKVVRDALVRGEIMFVFDCSASMQRLTPSGSRLDVARAALMGREPVEGVLERLAGTGLYKIGLRIYGHRVGWNPSNVQEVRRREDEILKLFPGAVNRDAYLAELRQIRPGDDVDRVLPITDFTGRELTEVGRLLYKLKPWGITPLYLSIVRAVEQDFEPGSDATQRRIVVLTDGKDEQTQDPDLPRNLYKNQKAVIDAFEQHRRQHRNDPIQLDVVGFQLSEARELEEIAKQTGGGFYRADDPQQLIGQLERSLGLSNFEVVPQAGSPIGPGDFGKWLEIDPAPRKPTSHLVRLLSTRSPVETSVVLSGGEALEMQLSDDGRRLEHRRYNQDLRDSAERLRDPDPRSEGREFLIATHQPPTRSGNEVRFPISFQSWDETQFTPRPQEAWVEIRPLLADGTALPKTYTFFDRYFEPGRPVPVLLYEVPHWPAEATQAEIDIWCKLHSTEANREVTLGEVADRTDLPASRRSIPDAPGVTFDVQTKAIGTPGDERTQVVVSVRHAQAANELDGIKVELDPPPQRVLHRYFDNNQLARHYFEYDGVSPAVVRDYRLQFTTAQRLKQGAIHPERRLTVRIPAS